MYNFQSQFYMFECEEEEEEEEKREKIILKNKDISFLTQHNNTETHPQEYINLPLPTWKIAIRNVWPQRECERKIEIK